MIIIMLIVGYKLIFDPYRPESPNSCWSQRPVAEETSPSDNHTIDNINYDVPVQTGANHDYIMENTFQKPFVITLKYNFGVQNCQLDLTIFA